MCNVLRVLNAVRSPEVGIPLTYPQYVATVCPSVFVCVCMFSHRARARRYVDLTPDILVNRLIARRQYLLALRICDYLKLSKNRVLVHWACTKVTSGQPDDQVRAAVVNKLAGVPGISYAEIADAALRVRRTALAVDVRVRLSVTPVAHHHVSVCLSVCPCSCWSTSRVPRCRCRCCCACNSSSWRWPRPSKAATRSWVRHFVAVSVLLINYVCVCVSVRARVQWTWCWSTCCAARP